MATQKCTKCGKSLQNWKLVMMMGPRGYRQYFVCEKCKEKIEKTKKLTVRAMAGG
jgi:hypothetical protein